MNRYAGLKFLSSDELFDLAEAIEQELYERIKDGSIAKDINTIKEK